MLLNSIGYTSEGENKNRKSHVKSDHIIVVVQDKVGFQLMADAYIWKSDVI